MNIITKTKNDGLKINVDGREIRLNNTESLLKSIVSGKINWSEFKKKYSNVDDVDTLLQKAMITRSEEKMVEILSLLIEISKSANKKADKQPDKKQMNSQTLQKCLN